MFLFNPPFGEQFEGLVESDPPWPRTPPGGGLAGGKGAPKRGPVSSERGRFERRFSQEPDEELTEEQAGRPGPPKTGRVR